MMNIVIEEVQEKTPKNEKLRDTLVTVHLDGMHMCIQVIELFFGFYAHVNTRQFAYKLLVYTCAYLPNKHLPECSSVFSLLR